jgi:inosine-uridine nucleoside N-ribohydrolase
MVEQVKKYPGEITIFSAGAMTNIALAVRMDSEFAKNTKALWVMGGFADTNLLMTSGSTLQADINTDVRFIMLVFQHDTNQMLVQLQGRS